jgi:DNA invertase Pin-like site-specific DNA recombinase
LRENTDQLVAVLKREQCKRIFTDKARGASRKRPELEKCL